MRKILIVLVFLVVLLSSSPSDAMSKFERFLLYNPSLFRLLTLGTCILLGLVIIVFNYLSDREENVLLRTHLSEQRDKEKEIAKRVRAYKKIPKGLISDASLPPAKLVHIKSKKEHEISPIRELTIGRSLENSVVVGRISVSRYHAKIRPQKEGYVLYDLLSTVGTYVNDRKIEKHVLKGGDIIGISRENFLFKSEQR